MRYPKPRLSLLMFIQFFVAGATQPVISLYLKNNLGLSGTEAGLVMALSAVGSIVSPILMTFIADRIISSERLTSVLHFGAGLSMLAFSVQTEFSSVLFFYIVYNLMITPTYSLVNAITFHHTPSKDGNFGNIRVWGTIGWISIAWFFSFAVLQNDTAAHNVSQLPLLLQISAITCFIISAYSFTIPSSLTHELKSEKRAFFPIDSLRIIMKPQVLTLTLTAAAITFIDRFYSVGTAPFLRQIGFSEKGVMPAMSLGQIPEIFAMGLLGYILKRWGMKRVLMAGMCLEIFRFGACAFGSSRPLVYASLGVHGLAYTFIFITAIISLDGFCGNRERTGVHQFYSVLSGGVGGFLGNFTAGKITDCFSDSMGVVYYEAYWMVPFLLSVFVLALLAVFIEDTKQPAPVPAQTLNAAQEDAVAKTA